MNRSVSTSLRKRGEKPSGTTKFLEIGDLMERWGVARQTLERWSRQDPEFPPAHRFFNSKVRKFALADVEAYERAALKRAALTNREARV